LSSPTCVVIWSPVVHVQTPSWQSIATVAPLVSSAVHPHAPLPLVHVGFSQMFVRSGVAGAAAGGVEAGADAGAAAGCCCVEAAGERTGEVGVPPPLVFASDAPELRRSSEVSVSAEQAVIRAEERTAMTARE
jgi:hypothetical protein